MTAKLVFENIRHKPVRSLLSILLIGVPVTLILTLVGLGEGMSSDAATRARGFGADIVVRPKGSTLYATLSSGMSDKIVEFLQKQPHVKLAMGVLNHPVEGVFLGVTGIDLAQFTEMSGGFEFREGGPFQNPDDILLDEFYASQNHKHTGDPINVLNRKWRVAGVFRSGKLQRLALPIRVLQEVTSSQNKVSQIYLKLDHPANTNDVTKALSQILPDYPIYSMDELTSSYNPNNVPALRAFTFVVAAVGVIIGFAVVCLSMYMSVLQRTREIGILKSLGASKPFILRVVLAEAVVMGIGGTILGVGMSFGSYWAIHTFVPASFQMAIVPGWWPIAGAVTLCGTILGALYPGWIASSHDPIEALAYE